MQVDNEQLKSFALDAGLVNEEQINEAIAQSEQTGTELKVAMLNPEDIQTIDFIRKKTGLKISICITTEKGIENALKQYEQSLKAEFGDIIQKTGEEEIS